MDKSNIAFETYPLKLLEVVEQGTLPSDFFLFSFLKIDRKLNKHENSISAGPNRSQFALINLD